MLPLKLVCELELPAHFSMTHLCPTPPRPPSASALSPLCLLSTTCLLCGTLYILLVLHYVRPRGRGAFVAALLLVIVQDFKLVDDAIIKFFCE